MKEKNTDSNPSKNSKIPLYLSLLFLAIILVCYVTIPAVNEFFKEAWTVLTSNDEDRIKTWVKDFGWIGPVVIVLAMVVQMFLLIIPTILLMIVAILAYGPFWGSAIIFLAVFVASTVGYAIGKFVGINLVVYFLGGETAKRVTSFLENYGFWAVVITRINPFLSNDAISFVSGILKMNYWKFITATIFGIAPLTIFIAIMGRNTASLKTGLLWGSIVSFIVFVVYIWWDKKRNATN